MSLVPVLNKKDIKEYDSKINNIVIEIENFNELIESQSEINSLKELPLTNVVSKEKLRQVQQNTLRDLKKYLSNTYGPMTSYTEIITGNNKDTILANYSKDGLKVLKHIIYQTPLEMAIQSELVDVATYVEKQIGDGTTSAVILSSLIFDLLIKLEDKFNLPQRKLVSLFKKCVENIQKSIISRKRDIKLSDIYHICMISTNGNETVSKQISSLYEQFGFDVSIDVGISNDANSKVKIYDGLTINEGYSDPAYINNTISGTADIHNARIYAFEDPIDTPEMVGYLEAILKNNIYTPISIEENPIPTVIITPKISRDASGLLTKLVQILYQFDHENSQSQKPPVLILTNLSGTNVDIYHDIANLCKCKWIKKYIDPELQKSDQEKGDAPTIDNVFEWYGEAELVSADSEKTKFINPAAKLDENDTTYTSLINFLKTEIKSAKENNVDHLEISRLKKRLRCLESNMIEYLIGGISISDRDSLKDLVEDAVKNCASAAENGVGYAANFEGLFASYNLCKDLMDNKNYDKDTEGDISDVEINIYAIIYKAYKEAARILYNSVTYNKIDDIIFKSIKNECPYNIMDLFESYNNIDDLDKIPSGDRVLCSINTDVEILNAISKIITTMATSNQALLQAPSLNKY